MARTAATGSRSPRKRGQLDRDLIVGTAITLASDGSPVTFRALGSALEADPTAVYRHFRDKDELVRALFDRLLQDVLAQIDPKASWREQLASCAELTMDVCEAHPWIGIEARTVTTHGPGELGSVELILESFQRAGLDQPDAVRFYAVYSGYVLSVAAAVAAGRLVAQDRGVSADVTWVGDVGPVDAHVYPALAAARAELAELRDREVFRIGLGVILDAAEAAARA